MNLKLARYTLSLYNTCMYIYMHLKRIPKVGVPHSIHILYEVLRFDMIQPLWGTPFASQISQWTELPSIGSVPPWIPGIVKGPECCDRHHAMQYPILTYLILPVVHCSAWHNFSQVPRLVRKRPIEVRPWRGLYLHEKKEYFYLKNYLSYNHTSCHKKKHHRVSEHLSFIYSIFQSDRSLSIKSLYLHFHPRGSPASTLPDAEKRQLLIRGQAHGFPGVGNWI